MIKPTRLFALTCVLGYLHTPVMADDASALCASDSDRTLMHEYYTVTRPGKPLPVPARHYNIKEARLAHALPEGWSVGTNTSAEDVRTIWHSLDTWGIKTKVGVVFAINGLHTFNFPSYIPVSQLDKNDGFQDIYGDDGAGVHGHLFREGVSSVYATKLPSKDGKHHTRSVNFYDSEGGLIISILAGEATGKGEQAAIEGFERTWDLIASMPQTCTP